MNGISIALAIHSLDYYYEPNDALNSYKISIRISYRTGFTIALAIHSLDRTYQPDA